MDYTTGRNKSIMTRGFVFGKFLPFHKGHEAMIRFALNKCDFVSVLVCCSSEENIPCYIRTGWIKNTFKGVKNIEVIGMEYNEKDLPNSSVSSEQISKIWSEKLSEYFYGYDFVITSEKYGDFVAKFMGLKHIPFDMERIIVPISGAKIRSNIVQFWDYLPEEVKPYFSLKVALLGTESTGKTTMANMLTKHYQCSCVEECGRLIIPNSNVLTYDDLVKVSIQHSENINKAMKADHPLVILDTDIHITNSYANFIFQKDIPQIPDLYEINKASLYLYLNNDVPHIQDGTRLNEFDRNLLDISHRNTLKLNKIKFIEVTGSWGDRLETCLNAIDNIIKERFLAYY